MGGRLTVHSDGIGRGATFTLELPLTKAENAGASLAQLLLRDMKLAEL